MNQIIDAFANAIQKTGTSRLCMVTDLLWDTSIPQYTGVDLFHTTRGRTIPFSTGLKLANPMLKVVAFPGDLATIGGNHLVHASRRNMDIIAIYINSFFYKKIAEKDTPKLNSPFSTYGKMEEPFNIPHIARACGASYVVRWTAAHQQELTDSIAVALKKSGFSLIEVISPAGPFFPGTPKIDETIASEVLKFYHLNSELKNNEDTKNTAISSDKPIIVGNFVNRERLTFLDAYNQRLKTVVGDKFILYK